MRTVLILFLLAMTACGTRPSAPDDLAETVEMLGVRAIYPPREDVQPGDIFLSLGQGCRGRGSHSESVLLASLPIGDVRQAINDFARTRIELPERNGAAPSPGPGPQPLSAAAHGIFPQRSANWNLNRLRLATFPVAAHDRRGQGDVSASWANAMGFGFLAGAGGSREDSERISYGEVEELRMVPTTVAGLLDRYLRTEAARESLAPERLRLLVPPVAERAPGCRMSVGVLSRVFYARHIEFSNAETARLAAMLSAAIQGFVANRMAAPAAGTPPMEAGPDAAELRRLLEAMNGMTPGIRGRVAYGESGQLSIKQSFPRPLAVAVDNVMTLDLASLGAALFPPTPVRMSGDGWLRLVSGTPMPVAEPDPRCMDLQRLLDRGEEAARRTCLAGTPGIGRLDPAPGRPGGPAAMVPLEAPLRAPPRPPATR